MKANSGLFNVLGWFSKSLMMQLHSISSALPLAADVESSKHSVLYAALHPTENYHLHYHIQTGHLLQRSQIIIHS